ncbi:MAG: SDR family oxidoreductase [Rhodospirillaceae bacterium]|nr:MAG: SDR family oxidoreductase [Rhodospirillaceae bacterium]
MSLFDLTGKVAVITGSSKGIGRAIAERMAEHGAKVVISSRKAEACEAVAAGIRANGGEAVAHACNVSRKEELKGLVEATLAHWGRIDILVCNAAANPYYGPLAKISDEAMEKTLATNVKGVVWLANLVLPQMAERRDGVIIIISSIGGFIGSDTLGFYNVSKAAEQSLARSLAYEWGGKNIRVNCIAPGLVKTDFSRALWEDPPLLAKRVATSALKRIGDADEIAGTAVYLAARAGAFVTGQTIVVDGGRLVGVLPPD